MIASQVEFFECAMARMRDPGPSNTATDALLELLEIFREASHGETFHANPLGTLVPRDDLDGTSPRAAMEQLIRRFERLIAEGVERGEFPAGDPRARATLIVASLEGGLMLSHLDMDGTLLDGLLDHVRQYVKNGFRSATAIRH